MTKPKIKFRLSATLTYLYALIFVGIFAIACLLGWFLYKNFYQTVAQAQTIILLRQEVAPDAVNTKQVEAVIRALNNKQSNYGISPKQIIDIFSPRETIEEPLDQVENFSDLDIEN